MPHEMTPTGHCRFRANPMCCRNCQQNGVTARPRADAHNGVPIGDLDLCKPERSCYTLPARERSVRLFLGSSAVEHSTVNRMVAGSNPARGASNPFCASSKPQRDCRQPHLCSPNWLNCLLGLDELACCPPDKTKATRALRRMAVAGTVPLLARFHRRSFNLETVEAFRRATACPLACCAATIGNDPSVQRSPDARFQRIGSSAAPARWKPIIRGSK
jgi:hypothetical protein